MANTEFRHIGQGYDRADALDKVTGREVYTNDIQLPGMLYAKALLSPYARAEIISMDTSEAEALSGVHAVLTGKDTSHRYGVYLKDKRIIAGPITNYQGEVIAAVAAETEAIAEKAISLIKVEFKELPAVITIDDALEGEIIANEAINDLDGKGVFFPQKDSNIASWNQNVHGDVEKAFEESHLVVENEFYLPACAHVPIETHVAIAQADPYTDRAKIWTSAQSPFTVKSLAAMCFGVSESNFEVHVPTLGGGFGGKAGLHIEPLVILLSRASNGRPVKFTATREEEFNVFPTRAAMRTRIKTGVTKEGKLTGIKVYFDWDSGANADYGANVGKTAVYSGVGPYFVPNVEIHSRTLYTNKVFSTAYRGFGHLETHWANERQMDIIAQKLGMDPYEFRMLNILQVGDKTITGETIQESTGSPSKCLEAVAKEIGWKGYTSEEQREHMAKTGKLRGIGLASFHKAPAMPANTATGIVIHSEADGRFVVQTGVTDMGQGAETAYAQIAAEELDIPFEKVRVVHGRDTDRDPYDWQTVASKAIFMAGYAIKKACADIMNQMLTTASHVFRCDKESLAYENGEIYHKDQPNIKRVSYAELIRGYTFPDGSGIGGVVIGRGTYMAEGLSNLDRYTGKGEPALHWTFGAHAIDMEFDTKTGEMHIYKIATAIDGGRIINRKMATSQVYGGVIQGLGSAISEGYKFNEEGVLMNPSFTDYKILTANDLPDEIVPILIETQEAHGPYGARGLAEHPMIAVPSAVGNALYDATGINAHYLPLTPENVLLLMKKENAEKDIIEDVEEENELPPDSDMKQNQQ